MTRIRILTESFGLGELRRTGIPPLLRAVLVAAPVIAVLTVGALILTIPVWRGAFWSVAGRVHYTLVALAAMGFVWFLYYWNLLLGFWSS